MTLRLPFDVYFAIRHAAKWQALLDPTTTTHRGPGVDALHERIVTNEDCWIVSTYLQLQARVENVHLCTAPPAASLCVVSGLDFGIHDLTLDRFFIGARSDGPDPALCQLRVVQNPMQEASLEGFFIPHWPQPGLRPRDPARGDRIEQMVFYGSENNLDPRFRTTAFTAALRDLGITFRINGRDGSDAVAWNDYREADLVLAARNLTLGDARTKPASKLVNAWLAGVPALLGPEPAFQDLRRSPLDYFEVRTVEHVLGAVARLRADPRLHAEVVRNGQMRAQAHTAERIAEQWIGFLGGPAADAFARWRRTSRLRRSTNWLMKAPLHKWARTRADRIRTQGPRILDIGRARDDQDAPA